MNIRRPILAILTVLTLAVAGFAVAQTSTSDQGTTSGTMDSTQGQTVTNTENAPNEEGVQTVTGLISSYDNGKLVLRTQDGERTFAISSTTVHPATMQANLPVIVHYVTETGGDRAVRIEENTHYSAEEQTPGSKVVGNDQWPGAANKQNENYGGTTPTGSSTGSATGSTYSGSTATTDTTATGSTTGNTGAESSYSGATGTTSGSTLDAQGSAGTTAGTTTTGTTSSLDQTGSTGQTGSTYDRGTTGTSTGSTTTGTMNETTTSSTGTSSSYAGSTGSETNTAASADQGGYGGSTLPATGSDLPLVGLVGLAALAVAAGLRFGRNA